MTKNKTNERDWKYVKWEQLVGLGLLSYFGVMLFINPSMEEVHWIYIANTALIICASFLAGFMLLLKD